MSLSLKSEMNKKLKSEICLVCGETNSAGYHCGTVTCEACKKFFLRNVNGEFRDFKCNYSNNCVITRSTRTNCAQCRFNKCIQIGMKTNDNINKETVQFKEIGCAVCGFDSSGYHFGVITCEGCKGFFRRNVNDGDKFVCNNNNMCQISLATRNACRACRFNKCVSEGMNLKNCKIGRQSNLFKQKLKSVLKGSGEAKLKTTSVNIPETTPSKESIHLQSSTYTFKLSEQIEDSLEEQIRYPEKNILAAFLSSNLNMKVSEDSQKNEFYETLSGRDLIFALLENHRSDCSQFMSNITLFGQFTAADQNQLLLNSMHQLRFAQIAKQSSYLNYFDCNDARFQLIKQEIPFFETINIQLKKTIARFRELDLDMKEEALFSTYLMLSRGTNEYYISNLNIISIQITSILVNYMQKRRNEIDSYKLLIGVADDFNKLRLRLQFHIKENCIL